jgi:hypothetical protein
MSMNIEIYSEMKISDFIPKIQICYHRDNIQSRCSGILIAIHPENQVKNKADVAQSRRLSIASKDGIKKVTFKRDFHRGW